LIDVCKPDCPDRSGECHGTCERYLTAREKHIEENREINRQKRNDKEYRDYVIDSKAMISSRIRSQYRRKKAIKKEL